MGFGAFTAAGSLSDSDLFVIEQAGNTRKLSLGNLSVLGSWTPVLAGSTTAGSATYSVQTGSYIKIGKLVIVWFDIQTTSTHSGTGDLRITGLPFTYTGGSGRLRNPISTANLTFPSGRTYIAVGMGVGNNFFTVAGLGNGVPSLNLDPSAVTNGTIMRGQFAFPA